MTTAPLIPSKPAILEPLKWVLFRALEKLSDLRGNSVAVSPDPLPAPSGRRALWVFVSTIGELNAIGPFLRALHARLDHLDLVLITDHEHYRAPYLAQYPDATLFVTGGHGDDARRLALHLPPAMLLIAEIPALPSDAPCRFSYAFMRAVKKSGAPICLVNGWLYHYRPSCRMDDIENRLFSRDFIRMFDIACVQNEEVRNALVSKGAEPSRVVVTGNIKFDAVGPSKWSLHQARSADLLKSILACKRPVIVAGCVTSLEEQQDVLNAFARLRTEQPSVLLVIAPRHPEIEESITKLIDLLVGRGISHRRRSQIQVDLLPEDVGCLVLDTIGELKDFYAVSTIAYVGRNHNILEPLAFERPTVVKAGWNSTYPSYPVYHAMLQAKGIYQIRDESELTVFWGSMLSDMERQKVLTENVRNALNKACGATEKSIASIENMINALEKRGQIKNRPSNERTN